MQPTRICRACDRRLRSASDAIRRHTSLMARAIALSKAEHTEEQRQRFAADLVAMFNDAQAAWDSYRQHLIEHGLFQTETLPPSGSLFAPDQLESSGCRHRQPRHDHPAKNAAKNFSHLQTKWPTDLQESGNDQGYELGYVQMYQTENGRKIRFAANRRIAFGEAYHDTEASSTT